MLKGIGAAAAFTILPACGQQGSDLPTAATSTCSGSICIDLSVASNSPLTTIGGAMLVDSSGDTIMVIRVTDTDVVAASAICTHDGCSMNFDPHRSLIVCPCHNSLFSEDGVVVQGPARRPLKVYAATLANNTITVVA